MIPIDPNLLSSQRTAASAVEVARQLGQLAGFFMNDEALACAGLPAPRPRLPNRFGSCWPVIGVRSPLWKPLLLEAIVLPLQWRASKEHDPRLPPEILRCADAVVQGFGASRTDFSLEYADAHQSWPDLRRFDSQFIETESCYASLALGWEGLRNRIAPNPGVWASAAWNDGFQPVEMLEAKLATARIWNALYFFVAPKQHNPSRSEADRGLARDVELMQLGASLQARPREAMAHCFAHAYLEPDSTDWEACRHYHHVVRDFDATIGDRFYDRVLFQHVMDRCRRSIHVAAGVPAPLSATHLVTIATRFTQPIRVIAGALGVKHVLILYTVGPSDMQADAEFARQQIRQALPNCDVTCAPFHYDPESAGFPRDFKETLQSAVRAFVDRTPGEQIVFDMDRGLTMHKFALQRFVIRPRNLVATLYHEMAERNRIKHGSERILAWRAADDWSRAFVGETATPAIVP